MSEIMGPHKKPAGGYRSLQIKRRMEARGDRVVCRMPGQCPGKPSEGILVDFLEGAVPRVKPGVDLAGSENPDFWRKPLVQDAAQAVDGNGNGLREIEMGDLPPGRDPGIGPSGSRDPDTPPKKGCEAILHGPLNGPVRWLNLPTGEQAAIVGDQ